MAHNRRDDDLAYGDYHGEGHGERRHQQEQGDETDRGFIGDVGRRFFGGGNSVSPVFLHTRHSYQHYSPCPLLFYRVALHSHYSAPLPDWCS